MPVWAASAALLISLAWSPSAAGKEMALKVLTAEGGILPIILVENPAPQTKAAAFELAAAMETIAGVRPKVHETLPDPLPKQAIWVGYQKALDPLFPGVDFALTKPEEIFLVGNENHIAITGRDIWDPEFSTLPGRRFLIENWQREYGNANAVY